MSPTNDRYSRRTVIVGAGAAGATALAGCGGTSDTDGNGGGGGGNDGNGGNGGSGGNGGGGNDGGGDGGSQGPARLTAEGSSTVYPISNTGASYWNGNPPADDKEYWGPGQYGIDTDKNLADYFASQYGIEPTGERANPPLGVQIGLSHSGTGCKSVVNGNVDIGNSSGPITAELDWTDEKAKNTVVDHVVGRDGQPVFVSQNVYDGGVTELTGDEVRGIYQGDITNWSEVGGPDEEIFVIGRAEGSGTDTSFRLNMLGDADAPMEVDTRKGQNQQVKTLMQQNEGAIGYMALAFQGDGIEPVAITFEGTTYKPDKDAENTIFDSSYPLNRDLHMYTLITDDTAEGTDAREAAFIQMFLTEFGQELFVEGVEYIPLPTKDIEAEQAKLDKVKA